MYFLFAFTYTDMPRSRLKEEEEEKKARENHMQDVNAQEENSERRRVKKEENKGVRRKWARRISITLGSLRKRKIGERMVRISAKTRQQLA